MSQQLLAIALGWVLGIGSHFIIHGLTRRKDEREIKAALKVELGELEYRMATVIFQIDTQLGKADKKMLQLIRPIVAKYEGANYSENLLGYMDKVLAMSDAEIAILAKPDQLSPNAGMALQKYEVPYLNAKIGSLSFFDHNAELQSRLLEVRASLSLFNDLVDQSRFYTRLTFSDGISEVNMKTVRDNVFLCYNRASVRAKALINHIGKIRW